MKLYAYSSGSLETKKHLITFGRGLDEPFTIPVPFFLIEHPQRGYILFDTGMNERLVDDAEGYWGSAVEAYRPVMTRGQSAARQLSAAGASRRRRSAG